MKLHAGPGLGEDRGKVPAAVEDDSESAWAEFAACAHALEARLRRRPGSLAPIATRAHLSDGALAGELAASPRDTPQAVPSRLRAGAPVQVDDVMRLARVNDRVCPTLQAWRVLYQLLPVDAVRAERAPFPVDLLRWNDTPDLHKQQRLREQLEWARDHDALAPVGDFLARLRESQWHHQTPTEWPALPPLPVLSAA